MNFLLSHMPWRTKLARRLNPLPSPVRLCLLVLLASFLGSIPAQAKNIALPASWYRSSFVMGDFDGDHRPDLATVQSGTSGLSAGRYNVRIDFSAGGSQFVDVEGPTEGLRIAQLDVNGDAFPDLVFTSAAQAVPVAILLNDGQGTFSHADPSAFPGAFGRTGNTLNGELPSHSDTITIPTRSPVVEISEWKYLLHPRLAAGSLRVVNAVAFLSALLVSLPERAPPVFSRA